MKICVVGCGHWGSNHIREFHDLGVLSCICDTNEILLQKYNHNVNTYTNFDDALEDCDAVVIALPSNLHFEFAKKALLMNKDVFIEKPMTLNSENAQELIDISKEKCRILMIGHIMVYNQYINKVKDYLSKIGNIKYIRTTRSNLCIGKNNDNVLWDLAPHDISIIFDILNINDYNDVIINYCRMTGDDICHISSTFNNIDIDINISRLTLNKESKLEIIGDRGMISFDDCNIVNKKLTIIEFNKIQYNITIDDIQPLTIECKHFIECCEKRISPRTSGDDGLKIVGFIQRCSPNKNYYVNPTAIVDHGAKIGNGVKIWHFSHLGPHADIGDNCSIGQNCCIDTKLGSGCRLQNDIGLCKEIKVGNNVFFGPGCVFTNDKTPRLSGPKKTQFTETIIEDNVSIGSNATIVCGITLGKGCLIGAGSVVVKNVESYSVVVGNPARKIKNIDENGNLYDI